MEAVQVYILTSRKKKPMDEKKKKVRVCYYLPKAIREFVAVRAKLDGMSRSCYVSSIIRERKEYEEGCVFTPYE